MVITLLLTVARAASDDWKLLYAYPPHYVSSKLASDEVIAIDGKLDDGAWAAARWNDGIVDITHHVDESKNMVPNDMQMRAKFRWDADFFYIGAELHEPFINGTITGHNYVAPYHDNDFECFIDPHGSGEYYVEFEMNALNATYDIKWGKPDGTPALCTGNGSDWATLPTCVNTSFSRSGFYYGNWSMINDAAMPRVDGGPSPARGMQTATAWAPGTFGTPSFPFNTWTLEIAFPIRRYDARASGGGWRGGILDADPIVQRLFDASDPNGGDAAPGRPRYWRVDVSRAEHPFNYTFDDGTFEVCPFNCTASLSTKKIVSILPVSDSAAVAAQWPTILGGGGGYWEWVWGAVGSAHPGVGYMHRPSQWPLVQFAPPRGAPQCRSIEWPARHVAFSVHLAMAGYAKAHGGAFAASWDALLRAATAPGAALCVVDPTTSDTCDLAALQLAATRTDVFAIDVAVTDDAKILTRVCTRQPCYLATVAVTVPDSGGYTYSVAVNENRRFTATHVPRSAAGEGPASAPCL